MIDETAFLAAWKAAKADLQCCQYTPFRLGYIAGANSAKKNPIQVLYDRMIEYTHSLQNLERAYSEGYIDAEKLLNNKETYNKLINGCKQAIEALELSEPKPEPCSEPKE